LADEIVPEVSLRPFKRDLLIQVDGSPQNFKSIVSATVTAITPDGVDYKGKDGRQQSIKAGSVVLACGMKARSSQALRYHNSAPTVLPVGDCEKATDLRRAIRSAFAAASEI
jgi:hypothetical protein